MTASLGERLDLAFEARAEWLGAPHDKAFRLFNGFTEGLPALALDVYGSTLVLHDASESGDPALSNEALQHVLKRLNFISCALRKTRHASSDEERAGTVVHGQAQGLARRVKESGITYALELNLNRDCSLYLDTRCVRRWAHAHLSGARVLNTFAYTGSLGVAAKGAGAQHVLNTDLSQRFLQVAKDSYAMNGWQVARSDFRARDFFDLPGELKRDGFLFDCVFVDPPFFSRTAQGTVDVAAQLTTLINKVRPLVAHEGKLVIVNSALFVSGEAFEQALAPLMASGYATLTERLNVDADFLGASTLLEPRWPTAPAPYNHSTKVAVIELKRKDGRKD